MLTAIVLVLVLIAVLTVAAWWFFEFDAPEVVIPAAAPGVGAGVLYWYGGPLAWATVALLAGGNARTNPPNKNRAEPGAPPAANLVLLRAISGQRRYR